jgi:CDP-paratose 2-epimerase
MLAHRLGRPLTYIGYGGIGKQVRDLLHIDDLVDLVEEQLESPDYWRGATFNVGGGRACSLSLRETTEICQELTGKEVPIHSEPLGRPGDVPLYVSDCRALFDCTSWRPRRSARRVLEDIDEWLAANEDAVRSALDWHAGQPARPPVPRT